MNIEQIKSAIDLLNSQYINMIKHKQKKRQNKERKNKIYDQRLRKVNRHSHPARWEAIIDLNKP